MAAVLTDSLQELLQLGPREYDALMQAKILSLGDLLLRMPRRYEDRTLTPSLHDVDLTAPCCLHVRVYAARTQFSFKRYFEAVVGLPQEEHGARLYLRWFHMPYLSKILAVGQHLYIYGKVQEYGGRLCMMNPDFEIHEDDTGIRLAQMALGDSWDENCIPQLEGAVKESTTLSIHANRIVPIYRNVSGIAARRYREYVWQALALLDDDIKPEVYDIAPSYPLYQALQDIHFPQKEADAHKARMRFALSECFLQQFKVQWRRQHTRREAGQVNFTSDYYLQELKEKLPFEMTGAQLRCIEEIKGDMQRPEPMNRLLQGDVGSGKTLVALAAMLMAVESGKNAALMAPTQILARQHYENFCRLLQGMDIPIYLKTSEGVESAYEANFDKNQPRIYVGTHALLYQKNKVDALGLAVIDEQHKFGVMQREKFTRLQAKPDVLVMSATPIPRTLTLTLYGDLDVSIIDELPAARGKIVTALRHPKKMQRIIDFMQQQLAEGRQIYVVSPLVEESEKREQKAAAQELERWREQFPQEQIELLHGRMSAEEKTQAMEAFHRNEASILVATTVVEVGMDVPNATIMLINNADCFGLSQLHQLRGRIGRGGHHSYCILLSDAKPKDASYAKLDFLCRSLNGFEIAEEDFRLRGPGDVLGTDQSGLGRIRYVEWLSDMRLIHRAKRDVSGILERDPDLKLPQHADLKEFVADEQRESVTA